MGAVTDDRAAIDAEHERLAAEQAALDAETGGDPDTEDDGGQFSFLIGGKKPTTDKVRLYGGAIEIEPPEGGFKKGVHYVLRVEVLCHKAGFTDEFDQQTGDVVGCRDERGLKITGVSLDEG